MKASKDDMFGNDVCVNCGGDSNGQNLCLDCLEKAMAKTEADRLARLEKERSFDARFNATQGDEFQM